MAALTNAERQKRFKANAAFKNEGQGLRRVEVMLTTGAALALDRLAAHSGGTRRDILEKLLLAEQERVVKPLTDDEHDVFLSGKAR